MWMPVTIKDLAEVVKRQMAAIDQLKAENAGLRAELDSFVAWAGGNDDALGVLQRFYSNPASSESERRQAAQAALPFEKAKPAATTHVVTRSLFDTLEAAHQRERELRQANAKVIEGKVNPPALATEPPAA
jgi:hypothetical protein